MNIGNKRFSTKKACEEFTRQLVASLGVCEIRKDNEHYEYFDKLLEHHKSYDEKAGCGIDYFFITTNPLKRNDLMTMICRVDGSTDVFSWKKCSNARFDTDDAKLSRAMRNSISDGVIKFKRESELVCCNCNVRSLQYSEYECDHKYPPFSQLKADFMVGRTAPKEFVDVEFMKRFREEDKNFESEWRDYHNFHATYQILCKNCNGKKSNNVE